MKQYFYLLTAVLFSCACLTAETLQEDQALRIPQEFQQFVNLLSTRTNQNTPKIGRIEDDCYVFENGAIEYRVHFPSTPQLETTILGECASCFLGDEKHFGFTVAKLSDPQTLQAYREILNNLNEQDLPMSFFTEDFLGSIESEDDFIHIRLFAKKNNHFFLFVLAEDSFCGFAGGGSEMDQESFIKFIEGVRATPLEQS